MRDIDQIIRRAKHQGWRVDVGGSGHYRFFAPDGKGLVTVARSPSDHRAILNIEADLRRAGLVLDDDPALEAESIHFDRLGELRREISYHQTIIDEHRRKIQDLRRTVTTLRSES